MQLTFKKIPETIISYRKIVVKSKFHKNDFLENLMSHVEILNCLMNL